MHHHVQYNRSQIGQKNNITSRPLNPRWHVATLLDSDLRPKDVAVYFMKTILIFF